MSKLTLSDISGLSSNPTSAQGTINTNWAAIVTALENTLSRDGTTPNYMEADLDLNSNQLLNVADGVLNTDGVNLGQLTSLITAGSGIPTGGTAGQSLTKVDSTDYNVEWSTVSGGSSTFNGCTLVGNANISFESGRKSL